jgi:hypothetical protein
MYNEDTGKAEAPSLKKTAETAAIGYGVMRGRMLHAHSIGWAVKKLFRGLKVRRRGWNGRGMWLGLQVPDSYSANTLPYIYIVTATKDRVPWVCSQTDLLSQDWEIATVDEG